MDEQKIFVEGLIKPCIEMVVALLVVLLFVGCFDAFGATVDMEKIKFIESSGREHVTGEAGEAGLFQITDGVFEDFMIAHNCVIFAEERYNPITNAVVANWYLNEELPRLLRQYGLPVTERNIIVAYNAGIESVRNKVYPVAYLRKYFR